jgi:hypothetical protein
MKYKSTANMLLLALLLVATAALASPSISTKPWSDYPELPVELIGKNSVLTGPSTGPPLRPYSFEPIAHKLETSSDTETRLFVC